MRNTTLTLPELAVIAGTRVALGAGAALLMAGRLSREQRRTAGWTLFAIGALSTLPLALLTVGRLDGGRETIPDSYRADS